MRAKVPSAADLPYSAGDRPAATRGPPRLLRPMPSDCTRLFQDEGRRAARAVSAVRQLT
jgi:hypothetical protein